MTSQDFYRLDSGIPSLLVLRVTQKDDYGDFNAVKKCGKMSSLMICTCDSHQRCLKNFSYLNSKTHYVHICLEFLATLLGEASGILSVLVNSPLDS